MWKVWTIGFTREAREYGVNGVHYKWQVSGMNTERNDRFYWQVPSVCDSRYDLSTAVIDSDCAEIFWSLLRAQLKASEDNGHAVGKANP